MPSLKHQPPHRTRLRAGGKNHARRLDPVSQASCVVSSRRNCGKRQHQTQIELQNVNRHYDSNQQYSITAVSDGGGTVVERYAHSAYGQVTIADGSGSQISNSEISNRYTYTGREWDEGLSLYHYRARIYDAVGGRFLSRDPIGFAGSPKLLYDYVLGSPLGANDPTGLIGLTIHPNPIIPFGICKAVACALCNNTVGANVLVQLQIGGVDGTDDAGGGNAFRHCLASCQSVKACGYDCAEAFWDGRETPGTPADVQDLANNQNGRDNANQESCWDACKDDWSDGGLNCQGAPCPPPL